MISLLKRYQHLFAWFVSSLMLVVSLFILNIYPKSATVFNSGVATAATQQNVTVTSSDFAATHLEPNFYQN